MIKKIGAIMALASLVVASAVMGIMYANTGDISYAFRAVGVWFIILLPVIKSAFMSEISVAIGAVIWLATSIHLGEFFGAAVWGALLIFSSAAAYNIWRYDHI